MIDIESKERAAEWAAGRVGPDNRVRPQVSIVCRWVLTSRGYEVSCRNAIPRDNGEMHPWHRVRVDFGKLVCNCEAYKFSRYSKTTPKTCVHLVGNNGLDGVAGWLELESQRGDLDFGQEAVLKASRSDPHRVEARKEGAFFELRKANAPSEAGPSYEPGDIDWANPSNGEGASSVRASASRGHVLENFFNR